MFDQHLTGQPIVGDELTKGKQKGPKLVSIRAKFVFTASNVLKYGLPG
jgi:hypothetical protein